jgi:hypothetical protein
VLRTLGEVATVEPRDEVDTFPWVDAATWEPSEIARDDYEDVRLPDAELDALFAEPDEQVGSVSELGWFGLVKHEGRPGGLVLIQDEQGFRHVREAPDDEALAIQWQSIQAECWTFYDQRDAYELATDEVGPSESGYAKTGCPEPTATNSGWQFRNELNTRLYKALRSPAGPITCYVNLPTGSAATKVGGRMAKKNNRPFSGTSAVTNNGARAGTASRARLIGDQELPVFRAKGEAVTSWAARSSCRAGDGIWLIAGG